MPTKTDTTIQFSGLKSGVYSYQYNLDDQFFQAFENEDLTSANVIFDVELTRKERLLMFKIRFIGTLSTLCDRCLDPLVLPVENEQTLTVRIVSDKFDGVRDTDDVNTVEVAESEYKIDLAQWLYEFVAIEMPLQHVHPDDENGNPTCNPDMLQYLAGQQQGHNEESTIDPRWAQLLDLKTNNNNKK